MKLTEHRFWSVLQFKNFTEAVTFAESHHTEDKEARLVSAAQTTFTGSASYAEAHQLATHGWPEGRRKVQKAQAEFTVAGKAFRPEITFDVVGNGGMDMGAVIAGIPECFMEWTESEAQVSAVSGPIVHIVFNGSSSDSVSTEAIENRGAAVLELIDALETAGRRVELTWVKVNSVSSGDTRSFCIEVPLKTAEYQTQPDQLVFALTHASMNRRIGFSLTRQCGRNGKQATELSYGGLMPDNWTFRGADVYIPRLQHTNMAKFQTVATARRWVLDQLRALDVAVDSEVG